MVPTVEFPPAVPLTSQVTVVVVDLVESLSVTVAVNENVVLIGTEAEAGAIATDLTVVDPEPLPLLPHAENIRQAMVVRTEPAAVQRRLRATDDPVSASEYVPGICFPFVVIRLIGSRLPVTRLQSEIGKRSS